jgi:tetratricopeptide (TPR) repeat protein
VRRDGVERGVERGGLDLAVATATYGILLLAAGWVGKGIEYLQIAAQMTSGWPSGRLRDVVLLTLASGHAFRGEAADIVEAVASQSRSSAQWRSSLLALRAAQERYGGDTASAVASYRAALDAAHLAANRDLVIAINNNLAGALTEAGDFADAEARLAAGEALLPAASPIRANLLGTRAELDLARGDLGAARDALDQSEALKNRMGIEGGLGWTLATRARLEAAAGNRVEARRLLDQSAGILEDMGASRAWRLGAAAIGEADDGVGLARPGPDPLLERVRAKVRVLPHREWEIQRGIGYGLAMSLALPLLWFAGRFEERIPGGWNTLTAIYAALVVLLFASILFRRVRRA